MNSLRGGAAVITGAASGIGRELALLLSEAGVPLALGDINGDELDHTVQLCSAGRSTPVSSAVVDVRDESSVGDLADHTSTAHGRIRSVFNVAGILHSGNIIDTPIESYEHVLATNFFGVVHGTKAFLPHILAGGGGHVVNVSSAFGLVAVPGYSAYNASKFAVRGFTDALRQEMLIAGHPVQVTCAYPGGVKTSIARTALHTDKVDSDALARSFDEWIARTDPRVAAEKILAGAAGGRAKVLIGNDARFVDFFSRIVGTRHHRPLAAALRRRQM
ncbi:SDR family NAD(P)-dependent oxidoreductase [Rhodococcus sp. O3]|uniref:SDR family NAD(P)-dependent oxidoreductase n=1 Tax=Rhodococcus sp. O3 TaxID=3404919 RepID=UPI003B68576A